MVELPSTHGNGGEGGCIGVKKKNAGRMPQKRGRWEEDGDGKEKMPFHWKDNELPVFCLCFSFFG
jgi:hypothetical protein